MRYLTTALSLATVASLTLLSACGSSSSPDSGNDSAPIKIGGMAFVTGPFSSFGSQAKEGMELGVKYVNSHGGVLDGRKLALDLPDTQSKTPQAITAIRKLAGDSSVVGVIGPEGTPDLLPIVPLAPSLKLPILAYGSIQDIPNEPSNLFRVTLVDNKDLTNKFMSRAVQEHKIKTVGLFVDPSLPAMVTEGGLLKDSAADVGYTVTASEKVARPATQFGTQIGKVLATHPDAIYIAATPPINGQLMSQARARGYKGIFLGGTGLQDPDAAKVAGAAATGYETYLPYDLGSSDPLVQAFTSAFKKEYPDEQIGIHTVETFDAVLLLADAVNRAGSTDRDEVLKALSSGEKVPTVEGPYTFSGSVNADAKLYFAYMGSDGALAVAKDPA